MDTYVKLFGLKRYKSKGGYLGSFTESFCKDRLYLRTSVIKEAILSSDEFDIASFAVAKSQGGEVESVAGAYMSRELVF